MRDLVVGFGPATVLDHVTLDVLRGEILGFVGGSGAGKSVLMRTIIGLLPKRNGTIEVLGQDIAALSERERRSIERRWGVLFQQGALFSSLNVQQNVEFPIRENLKDLSPRLIEEIALAKLEMVGLSADVRKKYPAELSGGMIKRAALARALALEPDIVFLDEPTSGLDPIGAAEFDELIRTLAAHAGLKRLHGHARSRQPARDLRPHRSTVRRPRDRLGTDRDHARVRASVAQILLPRQTPAPRPALTQGISFMETKANYVVTGLFTLAVIAGAFGFIFWFQRTGSSGEETPYRVVFDGSVAGLRTGAAVTFNGIRVGEVGDLTLDARDPRKVVALLKLDRAVPVRADTKAGLTFQGLTGLAEVSLTGGSADAGPLVAQAGQPPTLYADASETADVTQQARAVLARIDAMVADNETALHASLHNIETVTNTLADNSQRLDKVMAGLQNLTGGPDGNGQIGKAAEFDPPPRRRSRQAERADFRRPDAVLQYRPETIRGLRRGRTAHARRAAKNDPEHQPAPEQPHFRALMNCAGPTRSGQLPPRCRRLRERPTIAPPAAAEERNTRRET